MEVEFPRQGFDCADLRLVRTHLQTHEEYRASVTSKPDATDTKVNNQWQAALKVSSMKVMRLMEDTRCKNQFNNNILIIISLIKV